MKQLLGLISVCCLLIACENTFNTDGDDKTNLFTLTVAHSITKITDTAVVQLSWDEVSVDDFKEFTIERRQSGQSWTKVGSVTNRVVHAYSDVIFDDEDLEYRVGIMDKDGNVRWAEGATEIPRTTILLVPEEQPSPALAFNTPLIDAGDSILVDSGKYSGDLVLTGKKVYLISIKGFEKTIINGRVTLNTGLFEGFTVAGNAAMNAGGGVAVMGDGVVRGCYITENFSSRDGGGVLIKDQGVLLNSILFNNFSAYGSHNLVMVSSSGRAVNNTIVYTDSQAVMDTEIINTNISMKSIQAGFVFLNNIVFGTDTSLIADTVSRSIAPVVDYSRMDTSTVTGEHIILADPQFVSLEPDSINFRLAPGSPCINAGHPDPQYNNRDGSRNTLGAYGGPGGL